jgi:CubicO group peptidase (beta-lactamase class C family)
MAGVPQMPADVTPEMMTDWDAMCTAIASHEPLWPPGTQVGYHAWTFGWIIGEIIRRVDGRPIAQFAQEELCRPLGITGFFLGIPDAVESRVATLRNEPPSEPNPPDPLPADALPLRVMPLHVTNAAVVNRPDIRRAAIPGGGGIMTARAVARHYAMLANGGELDGVRILSPARIDIIRALQSDAPDLVLDRSIRRGLGYFLGGDEEAGGNKSMGSSGREFGHPGLGGSLGFADPEHRFAFGLTRTLLKNGFEPGQETDYLIVEEIRDYLDW